MSFVHDSRASAPAPLRAILREEPGVDAGEGTGEGAGPRQVLLAPAVGLWRDPPPPGSTIDAGASLGRLEILGELREIVAPVGARGRVLARVGSTDARLPVAFEEPLLILDPEAALAPGVDAGAAAAGPTGVDGLVVRAPSSGRYYRRPAPDKPAFVGVGETIREGQVIGLLEVMKTFTRISYGGPDLPTPARVRALLAEDEADVAAGQPLVAVEALETPE